MRHHKLVLPAHLNHYGYLFGGALLQWVDEFSWITASLEYPGCKFVTIGMERVEFRRQVGQGTILIIDVNRTREGRTSVEYEVVVSKEEVETGAEEPIFSTRITFVCLDAAGEKAEAGRFRRGLPERGLRARDTRTKSVGRPQGGLAIDG